MKVTPVDNLLGSILSDDWWRDRRPSLGTSSMLLDTKDYIQPIITTTMDDGCPHFASVNGVAEPANNEREEDMHEKKENEPTFSVGIKAILVKNTIPGIRDVIFSGPATVIIWDDDTKTVVKQQINDVYSEETGFAMCIAKKALGNKGRFNEVFKQWIPGYGEEENNPEREVFRRKFRDLLSAYNCCKDNGASDMWTYELLDSCKSACFYAPNGAELYLKLDSAMITHQEVMGIAEIILRHKGMLPREEKKKEEPAPDGTDSV